MYLHNGHVSGIRRDGQMMNKLFTHNCKNQNERWEKICTDYLHVPPRSSVTNPAENKQQQTMC